MLSKSQYTKYLQCPKAFWLYRKDKSKLSPTSPMTQHKFDTGTEVGKVAQGLFPGGVEVPFNYRALKGMARRTHELIDSGTEVIYEASFLYDDIFVAVDILVRTGNSWNIYEVKSATGLKDTFVDDMAVQAYVLESAGLPLSGIYLVTINNQYVREEELDLAALFTIQQMTSAARSRMDVIPERVEAMKSLLQGAEPARAIGPYCLSPYECDAKDYCWKTLAGVPEDSVFTLTGAKMDRKFELYEEGIIRIAEVPLEDCTENQKFQVKGEFHVEREPIRAFVESLEYPITHLDFESFQSAIPEHTGIKPYQQIPFQYSLHIESRPAAGGLDTTTAADLVHREFLAEPGTDPRRALAERLLADVPESGTILTYNQVFEKGIIGRLAETFPDLRKDLLALQKRIADLMEPFAKRWYYHPDQHGKHSIKNVLPALVPEMADAYGDLPGVANGGEASIAWPALSSETPPRERDSVLEGLRKYCELDTHAMVKILEVLRRI